MCPLSGAVTVRTGFEEVVYALGESSGSVVVCAEILSPAVAEREFFLLLSSSNRDAGTSTNCPTIVLCAVLDEPLPAGLSW